MRAVTAWGNQPDYLARPDTDLRDDPSARWSVGIAREAMLQRPAGAASATMGTPRTPSDSSGDGYRAHRAGSPMIASGRSPPASPARNSSPISIPDR